MVEIYFNAQSDNGTLTDSRWIYLASADILRLTAATRYRSRTAGLVQHILAEPATVQGPASGAAAAELDDGGGLRRGRE